VACDKGKRSLEDNTTKQVSKGKNVREERRQRSLKWMKTPSHAGV
jgi:hypothetical protein